MPTATTKSDSAVTRTDAASSASARKPAHPTSLSTKTPAEIKAARDQYDRGEKISTKAVKDKKLRGSLKKLELRYRSAATAAADSEILRPETGPGFIEAEGELERTWKVRQGDIRSAVDVATAEKGFNLDLGFGEYYADYTRDGRDLLLAGKKGHVATFDWREGTLGCELQLGETVRDAR
jgi:U3 small nucleolar RNA-associated protein 7